MCNARRLLYKLLRLAYERGADWLEVMLEYERESASAQLAFALKNYEWEMGTPEEQKHPREETKRGESRPAK